MTSSGIKSRVLAVIPAVIAVIVITARAASAQDTVVTGTIIDASDAVLPGVSVTALLNDTGNTFTGVTDAAGVYRIGPVRPGVYTITAELPGFATVQRENLELLLGQRAVLNLRMALSGVSETIRVSGAAPLIDASLTRGSGNIDTRQMEALPINGRDWKQLTMLAPGSRVNAVDQGAFGTVGSYQLNVDGQDVTNQQGYLLTQPKFSREAIAEFEMIGARFDATQGNSRFVMVNAVTKSGTNTVAGSVYGYFRDDRFNAADFIAGRVLPYSNQQAGGTFGGPLLKDKLHFFAYYEGEREPFTVSPSNPLFAAVVPADQSYVKTHNMAGGRVDWQVSSASRLLFRGNYYRMVVPSQSLGATLHPSRRDPTFAWMKQIFTAWTHVRGSTAHEIKGGLNISRNEHGSDLPGVQSKSVISLRGYSIGAQPWLRQHEPKIQLRDDWTAHRGRHEIKLGGEFSLPMNRFVWESPEFGTLDATLGAIPANIQSLFPVWDDASTWNLAPLSAITRSFSQAFGNPNMHCTVPGNPTAPGWSDCRRKKPAYAGWVQDNWHALENLTLNLGLRWDFLTDGLGYDYEIPPVKTKKGQDWTRFGPRVGFAYSATPKTVIRGGVGKYYGGAHHAYMSQMARATRIADVTIFNDGRPNFAADPWNLAGGGRMPTYEEALRLATNRDLAGVFVVEGMPFSYQTSVGVQRQLAESASIQVDYVWIHSEHETYPRQVNLAFNPATGVNYPFTNPANRPFPQYGRLTVHVDDSYSNIHSLEVGLTKRFSHRWQGSMTYSLSTYKNYIPTFGLYPGCAFVFTTPGSTDCNTSIDVAPDFEGSYVPGALHGLGGSETADQRHRAVFSGILELPWGFQTSGLYFYGSGQLFPTQYGADLRDTGGPGFHSRLRPDGTVIPYNNFRGRPIHRVDMSVRKRIPVARSIRVDAVAEVFNLFNHENYGSYTLTETSVAYGRPSQNLNVAYQPRIAQFGVKMAF